MKYTIKDLLNLLIEDNSLQKISFPKLNQELNKEKSTKGNYIFENNEKFKGKMEGNKFKRGIYTWPTGQKFYGNLSPDNKFNERGKITFPNGDELTGNFKGEDNSITKAIYKTNKKIYQGSFKNNKLDGKFIIKNIDKKKDENDDNDHYLFIGSYINGVKNDKFTLEKVYKNNLIKVSGTFKDGRKNGIFKIFSLNKNGNKEIDKYEEKEELSIDFVNDIEKSKVIENKKFYEAKEKNKIFCMEIDQCEDNLKLLLGSYENLLVYNIDIESNQIFFFKKILLFEKSDINDIIKLKNENFLLSGSNNVLKLINLKFENNNNISSDFSKDSTSETNNKDFEILQEFNGESNSKNIFSLIELSNELVLSGDCENIIIWENENSPLSPTFISRIIRLKEKKTFNYIKKGKIKCSHTYCMLELENLDNKILLAYAQPDSQSIDFISISKDDNYKIENINSIFKVNSLPKRKNIMTIFHKKLFVGCNNSIIIIDLDKYEIISEIYNSEKITYINSYSNGTNDFLLFGMMRKKNSYNYEGYLSQKILENNAKEKIISISDFKKSMFKGNIINCIIYNSDNKEIIIAIGTNGQILVLNTK